MKQKKNVIIQKPKTIKVSRQNVNKKILTLFCFDDMFNFKTKEVLLKDILNLNENNRIYILYEDSKDTKMIDQIYLSKKTKKSIKVKRVTLISNENFESKNFFDKRASLKKVDIEKPTMIVQEFRIFFKKN